MTDITEATPRDFEALRSLIIERKGDLPKRLAQVAAHTLDNPDEIAFGTAASIAASAGVQPSTLVRFAQQLGFEGFSDLQQVFRERLKARYSSYEERLATLASGAPASSRSQSIFDGFMAAAIRSIETVSHHIDLDRLERAITLLAEAETIYLIASRRSFPISSYMAYAFGKMRIRTQLVGSPLGIDPEILAFAGSRDAAVTISFAPYAPATTANARLLTERGVPTVAITDSALSPLAGSATEWFEVSEADHAGFRSLSATMAFAMALTVGVMEHRRNQRPAGGREAG